MARETQAAYYWLAESPSGVFAAWSDAPLPAWRDELNAGPGEIRAKLPRSWTAMGLPGDARGSNELVIGQDGATTVTIYRRDDSTAGMASGVIGDFAVGQGVIGNPAPGLQFLYRGTLEELTPAIGATQEETEFLILPAHTALMNHLDEVLVYVDVDPVLIARNLFERGYLPGLTWDPRNPTHCGRVISQVFQYQTFKSILQFCSEACGAGWYFHCDERGMVRLWQPDVTVATHVVQVGRELAEAQYTMTRVLMRNQVIMRGKGTTTYTISPGSVTGTADLGTGDVTGSASGMGLTVSVPALISNQKSPGWTRANARSASYSDPSISDQATLDLVAQSLLERLSTITVRARLRLVSHRGALAAQAIFFGSAAFVAPIQPTAARGAALEAIRPGDTLQLWLDGPDPGRFIVGEAVIGTAHVNGAQLGIMQRPIIVSATAYSGGDTLDVELSTPQPSSISSNQRVAQLVEKALGASLGGS